MSWPSRDGSLIVNKYVCALSQRQTKRLEMNDNLTLVTKSHVPNVPNSSFHIYQEQKKWWTLTYTTTDKMV